MAHRPHTVVFDVVENLMSLSRTGARAADVALVAVHVFGCHGAHAPGLSTGWATRLERHYAQIFSRADVIGEDLLEVATGLIGLPER